MLSLSLSLSLLVASAAARTFFDDAGVTHTTTAASPTIVVGAMDAISLMHFGMTSPQIAGTFGERATSGSNYGGTYGNGNAAVKSTIRTRRRR
eukprot:4478513-Prymnesium_polylepis.3